MLTVQARVRDRLQTAVRFNLARIWSARTKNAARCGRRDILRPHAVSCSLATPGLRGDAWRAPLKRDAAGADVFIDSPARFSSPPSLHDALERGNTRHARGVLVSVRRCARTGPPLPLTVPRRVALTRDHPCRGVRTAYRAQRRVNSAPAARLPDPDPDEARRTAVCSTAGESHETTRQE